MSAEERFEHRGVKPTAMRLLVYKELERRLKAASIGMSVDKVLNMAKTVTTIVFRLPESGKTFAKTMPMNRHQRIAKLFTDEFWGTR